jgi:hypothetical protein
MEVFVDKLLDKIKEDPRGPRSLCEAIKMSHKAGLTIMKAFAFIEQRLKPEGGKIGIKLPVWMRRALREEAKRERITQAELVRRALTIYLELTPEERESLVQALRNRWWRISYLMEHLDEVEEAYKREMAKNKDKW